jgi:hypothetical protein
MLCLVSPRQRLRATMWIVSVKEYFNLVYDSDVIACLINGQLL